MPLKAPDTILAPKARRSVKKQTHHGKTHEDPYYWLKDPSYPDVKDAKILKYLRAENKYYETVMNDHLDLTEDLFDEVKGRIKEDDEGVPWREGAFEYRWEFKKGAQYRTWSRRSLDSNGNTDGEWAILLDENEEAKEHDYFKLGSLEVSPDGAKIAFSADTNGSERFRVFVREIESGKAFDIDLVETSGEVVWTSDSKGFYCVKVSEEWRPYLVNHADLNGEVTPLYEEADSSFFVHIGASSSDKYLTIRSADHVTAENRVLALDGSESEPVLIAARRDGHDYSVDHGIDGFYARSNKDQKNFSIYKLEVGADLKDWTLVLEGSDQRYIRGFQLFKTFMAVDERIDGLDQILVWPHGKDPYHIDLPEAAYEVGSGNNPEFTQSHLRIVYSSMVTPPTVFDYDLKKHDLIVRKEQEIPSGYDKSDYTTERLIGISRDGTKIPVSIVYKNDWKQGEGRPLHLYGYGAYGLGMSPSFSSARLSLLDRGFAYAIAHIRGGDELGYGWYEAGKLEARENTFNDFVDVARTLVDEGYAAEGEISISGGSAGGELMGAVLNQAPDLFKAAVLHVPFVDVLNTMLDADLPLTPIEWPEWGNPIEDEDAYDHICSYCPYTNIEAKDYPPMMVTGGINDPRVTYWEPAKWTAKMRATKTDDNLLIMKINMEAGHGGKSGRFDRLHEVAEEYTFLLMAFNRA